MKLQKKNNCFFFIFVMHACSHKCVAFTSELYLSEVTDYDSCLNENDFEGEKNKQNIATSTPEKNIKALKAIEDAVISTKNSSR